jgi:hypothetical protein
MLLSPGTLAISGYVRHQDLDVNGLVYLPGHGAAQVPGVSSLVARFPSPSLVVVLTDPCSS